MDEARLPATENCMTQAWEQKQGGLDNESGGRRFPNIVVIGCQDRMTAAPRDAALICSAQTLQAT
jgi:hypothetical protein